VTGADARHETLRHGELRLVGRIRSASNATFLCQAVPDGDSDAEPVQCVYKPIAGEQPLWDFPDGTLAGRELASYLISAALGWDIVPHTVIRSGPAGPGMVQLWVDEPEEPADPGLVDLCAPDSVPPEYFSILTAYDYSGGEVALVHADHPQLRRMAVFDVVVNNADRKGGHILAGVDGGVYGVDHGVCLHAHNKLRTVLWGWAGARVGDEVLSDLRDLDEQLSGPLGTTLGEHITAAELSALRRRVRDLLDDPTMPVPTGRSPLPWPAF
jgi:uncharacterized repeat protein (TIGR03843 family)